jgi:hypothetical protein
MKENVFRVVVDLVRDTRLLLPEPDRQLMDT